MKNRMMKLSMKLSVVLILAFTISALFISTAYIMRHQVIKFLFADSLLKDIAYTKKQIDTIDIKELYLEGDIDTIEAVMNEIHKERPSVGIMIDNIEEQGDNRFKTLDQIVNINSESIEFILFDSFYVLYYIEMNNNYRKNYTLANLSENQSIQLEIYSNKSIEYLNYYLIVTILLTILIFIIIFVFFIHKKIKYIQLITDEVQNLQGGNFEHPVLKKGNDELGELAYQIDQMRLSFNMNEKEQKKLEEANKHIIKKMETNLSVPLSRLEKNIKRLTTSKEDIHNNEHIIQQSLDIASDINRIGNDVFTYFLTRKHKQAYQTFSSNQLLEVFHELATELESFQHPIEIRGAEIQHLIYTTEYSLDQLYQNLRNSMQTLVKENSPIVFEMLQKHNTLEIEIEFQTHTINSVPWIEDDKEMIQIDIQEDLVTLRLTFEEDK